MKLFRPVIEKQNSLPKKQDKIHRTDRIIRPIEKETHITYVPSKIDLSYIENKDLRIAFWSTWKEACGIAVYTEHLVNAFQYHGCKVFPYSNKLSPSDLLKQIEIDRPHIINIQYEPAICPKFSELISLIRELKNRRVKVLLTFHSEPIETKQLVAACDLAIFHRTPKTQNLTANIVKLPMGVPVFNPKEKNILKKTYSFNDKDIILSTTGFMFTWKQHADILQRLAPLLKSNDLLKIQLLTSFNSVNPDECVRENENIKRVIKDFDIENQVVHITDFISQQELSERLYVSDVGYLWSGITTSSTSAAGKEFITARLPLVATNSNHYHDLKEGTVKTDMNKESFIDKITEIINNKDLLISLKKEMEELYLSNNNNNIVLQHLKVYR